VTLRLPALTAAVALVAVLGGCAGAPSESDDTVSVVVSTDVYGSLVELVGGDAASVTSLISGARDPHSFEASARDQLAISRADLVIANGGGYDPFVQQLLDGAHTDAPLIVATDVPGIDAGSNEHLWYDLAAMELVAAAIADALGDLDPTNAELFAANYASLAASLMGLEAEADALRGTLDGRGVVVTEPVPLYLLERIGLRNRTPDAFTEAIEEGADVPPAALAETLALLSSDAVVMLAYNDQTSSPETERVRNAAEAAGIPVVSFTETLPAGKDYVTWMTANLAAIGRALLP
jgi:zinc/manganese transport system substrate-binding protein